jgi:hypothetical protein
VKISLHFTFRSICLSSFLFFPAHGEQSWQQWSWCAGERRGDVHGCSTSRAECYNWPVSNDLVASKILGAFHGWRVSCTDLLFSSFFLELTAAAFRVCVFFLSVIFSSVVFKHSVGGMCGALVTAPFDVVKTRLQSDLYSKPNVARVDRGLLYHFVDTGIILR